MIIDPAQIEEKKKMLSQDEYHITQEKGTEAPFTGTYWNHHESGMYECVVCGQQLFSSETKFESGSGWPSFDSPINQARVILKEDTSHGMKRTEVLCKNCGAHLGHVFDDGPKDTTGMRYCINSCALDFKNNK